MKAWRLFGMLTRSAHQQGSQKRSPPRPPAERPRTKASALHTSPSFPARHGRNRGGCVGSCHNNGPNNAQRNTYPLLTTQLAWLAKDNACHTSTTPTLSKRFRQKNAARFSFSMPTSIDSCYLLSEQVICARDTGPRARPAPAETANATSIPASPQCTAPQCME